MSRELYFQFYRNPSSFYVNAHPITRPQKPPCTLLSINNPADKSKSPDIPLDRGYNPNAINFSTVAILWVQTAGTWEKSDLAPLFCLCTQADVIKWVDVSPFWGNQPFLYVSVAMVTSRELYANETDVNDVVPKVTVTGQKLRNEIIGVGFHLIPVLQSSAVPTPDVVKLFIMCYLDRGPRLHNTLKSNVLTIRTKVQIKSYWLFVQSAVGMFKLQQRLKNQHI